MIAGGRNRRLSLDRDGRDWPNRDFSRFVEADGSRWHFQRLGSGPVMLLIHGTGAATHTWRDVAPLLARDFDVIAPDLPGHGFTDPPAGGDASLPGMSRALGRFLQALDVRPDIVVGHSAGAAILARMCLDRRIDPRVMVSLNGAFLPFEGLAGRMFPSIAKLLFLNPLTPRVFAWSADRPTVTRLLRGTGSSIDAPGVDLYTRLFQNPDHVAGVLDMMANWDLTRLRRDLRRLRTPMVLMVADGDKAVPPATARIVAKIAPDARIERLRGLGHLAHEENPALIAKLIRNLADASRIPLASGEREAS